MATSYKATALGLQLLQDLNQRGPLTYTSSVSAAGDIVLSTGSGSAGAQNVVIVLKNYLNAQNALATTATAPLPYTTSLGLAATPFSPTVAQVSVEASTVANTSLVLAKNLAPVLMALGQRGLEVQLLLTANATAPTAGAGTLQTDFNGQVQYPGTATI